MRRFLLLSLCLHVAFGLLAREKFSRSLLEAPEIITVELPVNELAPYRADPLFNN